MCKLSQKQFVLVIIIGKVYFKANAISSNLFNLAENILHSDIEDIFVCAHFPDLCPTNKLCKELARKLDLANAARKWIVVRSMGLQT